MRGEWVYRSKGGGWAEGPVWDAATSTLWWVDIEGCRLHRLNPDATTASYRFKEPVGALALRRSGGVLVALASRLAFFDPDENRATPFVAIEGDLAHTRANDGKAAPDGTFWIGTMARDASAGAGSLYRVFADGTVQTVLSPVSISNGLDWLDDGSMYYVDSTSRSIDILSAPDPAGKVERRALISIDADDGLPDGLTCDIDGDLWVALHGGSCIRVYSPTGRLLDEIDTPALVTSCAFGGADLDDLFVTVADGAEPGGVLRIPVNATGREAGRFDG